LAFSLLQQLCSWRREITLGELCNQESPTRKLSPRSGEKFPVEWKKKPLQKSLKTSRKTRGDFKYHRGGDWEVLRSLGGSNLKKTTPFAPNLRKKKKKLMSERF